MVSLLNENKQFKYESETKCCLDGLGVLITKKKPSGRVVRRKISIETVMLAITYFKSFISLAMYEGVKKQSARITRKSLFPEQSKTGNY